MPRHHQQQQELRLQAAAAEACRPSTLAELHLAAQAAALFMLPAVAACCCQVADQLAKPSWQQQCCSCWVLRLLLLCTA
jgi:hypothetical protein